MEATPNPVPVPWEQFHKDVISLAGTIAHSNAEVDTIVAISRGGLVPARILAQVLGVKDIAAIRVRKSAAKRTVVENELETGANVLLVEDCLESGKSLEVALSFVQENATVVTATVYDLAETVFRADFVTETRDKVPAMPWEKV